MNQNVKRLIGKAIDMYLCTMVAVLLSIVFYTFIEFNTVLHVCLCFLSVLLFVGLDALNLSVGKRIFKFHIYSCKGVALQNVSHLQKVLRNLTIAIWPVEVIVLWKSKDHRRLGDRLAGTTVKHIENF